MSDQQNNQTLLIEIGTEELPPKSLRQLGTAFQEEICTGLSALNLQFADSHWYATPRRLAVSLNSLDGRTPDRTETRWGPPAKVAFDDSGAPTRAALAFAEKNGLETDSLKSLIKSDGKADKLCFEQSIPGQPLAEVLPAIIESALDKLPIAKRMRWGSSRQEFVRPIQWVCIVYGTSDLALDLFNADGELSEFSPSIRSGRVSQGHRFLAKQPVEITNADKYAELLEIEGSVLVNFAQRQEAIETAVHSVARENGGHAVVDADLLDEVTALVEWPEVLIGNFDREFLGIPAEALVSSMKEHQKYFHVIDDSGHLLPLFITVSNNRSAKPDLIVAGNERVIRPRLADAAFFYHTDLQNPLASSQKKLDDIVFQAKLGSVGDKVRRIADLSAWIAQKTATSETDTRRAAELSKCDLVSEMVGEFDSLQGIMGRYYALNDGEPENVALAIEEQYLPRFAGDRLPTSKEGICIALADRMDTLTGIFGIGEQPSGSRDPFALRRSSLGILRILVEHKLDIDLIELIETSIGLHENLPDSSESLVQTVHQYILDRFAAWFEADGVSPLVFPAVRSCQNRNAADIHQRVQAVQAFLQLEEAPSLAAANKRVSNLLSKASLIDQEFQQNLVSEAEEQALADNLDQLEKRIAPMISDRSYTDALREMAQLRDLLDRFFDQVMVMCDDTATRNNRLALLGRVRKLFLQVADISLLAVS